MSEFIRARNAQQKQIRMAEIKAAADGLFARHPYHEITLTTIAEQLSWSRANLYKYVTTKEEIFLELCGEKQCAYFRALEQAVAALPCPDGQSLAPVWAEVLCAHRDHLRYSGILMTIIETNVSVERLAAFKLDYYAAVEPLQQRLADALRISPGQAAHLLLTVHYHAIGMNGVCAANPLVQQALASIGREPYTVDFRAEMEHFLRLCLRELSGEKHSEES